MSFVDAKEVRRAVRAVMERLRWHECLVSTVNDGELADIALDIVQTVFDLSRVVGFTPRVLAEMEQDDIEQRRRKALWFVSTRARRQCDGLTPYQKRCGNPSGRLISGSCYCHNHWDQGFPREAVAEVAITEQLRSEPKASEPHTP